VAGRQQPVELAHAGGLRVLLALGRVGAETDREVAEQAAEREGDVGRAGRLAPGRGRDRRQVAHDAFLVAAAVDLGDRAGLAEAARITLGALQRAVGAAAAGLGDVELAAESEVEAARVVEAARDHLRTGGRAGGRGARGRDAERHGRERQAHRAALAHVDSHGPRP
jgi:hypothetical protein